MIDDYQYQSTPLAPKNEGLFGLGGQPSEGVRGFTGQTYDFGSNVISSNNSFTGGAAGAGGFGDGSPGSYVPLPDGIYGDMLYHNGSDWVVFNRPSSDGVLSIVAGNPTWITSNRNGSIIYYDSNLEAWLTIPAPLDENGTYVFKYTQGLLNWGSGFPDGINYGDILYWDGASWVTLSAPNDGTTYVLASTGGTPYWIATEECGVTTP
jgi:hypothetical protein